MQLINKIKDFFGRLFSSNNGSEVQPIFDASTIKRIEDDDRYINPNGINSSFDLMNFDRIRSLDKTNQKVDQTNQKVNEIEIKIDKNTEDINRLTEMMKTLAISTQNHEEKMAKL